MTNTTSTLPTPATATAPAREIPRWAWLAGGGALLAVCGIASAVVYRGKSAEAPAAGATPAVAVAAATTPAARATHATANTKTPAPAEDCTGGCGVVESVKAVKVKGQGTGAGAVVGGVLGGVVGHQMGGGTGKTAMTVLGAIGGGVAGNEVEKRARAETVYQVHLRMDDGSQRTVTLKQAPVAKGDRVAVDGQNLRRLGATTQAAAQ